MSKKTGRAMFAEAIADLTASYDGDPMKVPLAGALKWINVNYSGVTPNKSGFYAARAAISAGRQRTATVAAAGGLAVPPLQLIRTIKSWVEMYGKNELIAMIDEVCP